MFAIMVIQKDGEQDYVCDGLGDIPTRYPTRRKAQEFVDFMKIGMDGDVQSINVVPYPRRKK
jgi:hypothetical protein